MAERTHAESPAAFASSHVKPLVGIPHGGFSLETRVDRAYDAVIK
jgi:hypothetical protein